MLNRTVSHYRVLELLGKSGMGEVYKAEDLNLKRTVALKFLPPEWLRDQAAKQRLLDEAQAAAALNHSNIATVHELEQTADLSFIVMEYIEGETLARKIEQGPLQIIAALDIAIQVADVLRAAHARCLVHCDIKSSNIMLTADGSVKVLDFGLAKLVCIPAAEQAEACITAGTIGYMSPEQARGEMLDARTDIFSLGVVLYEALTGRLPFEGSTQADLLYSLLNDEPQTIGAFRSDAPLELESIVRKSLEKSRSERYGSIEEMLVELKRLKERLAASRKELATAPIPAEQLPLRGRLRRGFSIGDLVSKLSGRRDERAAVSLPKGAAFRGLLPFQEVDRDRFYGREVETATLFDMITHSEYRFGVLSGESGCGKTSLLKAGLLPKLWEEDYTPIYCRSYTDPLIAIAEECRRQSRLEAGANESPPDYLRRVAGELNGDLVIVCDQFEEFFINFKTEPQREPFVSFVAACHHATDLPVKFLFSIRSDFLYLIGSAFDDRIPDPLTRCNRYYLRNFDQEQAEEIIEKSGRRANLLFEENLIRHVARDLSINGSILPSELQIVGEQLQKHRIFTLSGYRRAGGKEPLVHAFLEDVIQASGDRETTYLILRSLISDENTRLTLSIDEISRRIERGAHRVGRVVKLFVQSRLIREIQEDEPWRYELMHEYLIEKINQITGKVINAVQRANRLLRQYLSSYSVDKRTRIPLGRLWTIHRYSDLKRGGRERELLGKSLSWGLLKAGAAVLLLSMATAIIAAFLSVSEQWEEVRLSDGHTAGVRRLVFSPDGRLLVSVGEDAKVIVWDFAHRERLATFTDHRGLVNAAAFSPDGRWFATGSDDKTVIVWDAVRLEKAAVLREHKNRIFSVGFSPDGRFLISTPQSPEDAPGRHVDPIILWAVDRWEKIRELPLSVEQTNNCLFSADSRRLIVPSGRSWDLSTGEQVSDTFDTTARGSYGAALSPDATQLVGVNSNGIVSFLSLKERRTLGSYRAHRDNGRAAAYSPDGRLAATGAENILLWDAGTQTKLLSLEHTSVVWSLAFSPDGKWLVSGHDDGAILLWNVAERERAANFNEHSGPVQAIAFSPNGKRLASAGEDRSVIIWDLERGQKEAVLSGHDFRIVSIAFSPDGRSVASTDFDGKLIYWDIAERKPHWTFKHSEQETRCVAVSPDGKFVVASKAVHESASGRQVFTLPTGYLYSIAFSTDGKRLACVTPGGGDTDNIYLFNVEDWRLIESLHLSGRRPLGVAYSPDGRQLATGDDDGTIRLWVLDPIRETAAIGRHSVGIKSLAFSPDGKRLVSAGGDQMIALWDVNRRRLIARIGSHISPVLSAAFSPDGTRIASGEGDKSVRVYTRRRSLWGYQFEKFLTTEDTEFSGK